MYTNVSDEFKEIVKSNAVTAVAKIVFTEPNITIYGHTTDVLDSSLQDVQITDNCYNGGQLIGTTMTKEVEIKIINKNNLDLADKEFELFVGVKIAEGEYEYIPYGKYIVTKYEDTKSNNIFKILAYDYMNNLNGLFKDIKFEPTFPLTLKEFREQLLTACNIEYETQTLANDNFVVNEMPNFDGMSIRTVLGKVAEIQGTFAKINRNNKMEFFQRNYPTKEVDGTYLDITDGDANYKSKLIIGGNSTQETRSGKNLLNLPSPYTLTGVLESQPISLEPGDYIVSASSLELGGTDLRGLIYFWYEDDTSVFVYLREDRLSEKFTATKRIKAYNLYSSNSYANSQGVTTTYTDLMISKEGGEYEPYGASPSPEFPSEIQSVGDDVNLWNNDFELAEYDENGNKISTKIWAVNKEKINVKPNTTYTISQKETPIQHRVIFFNNDTYLNRAENTVDTTNGCKLFTFTTPENCNKIYTQFRSTIEVIKETGGYNLQIDSITNVKLQKGTVATAYSEYGKGTVEIKQRGKNLFDKSKLVNNTFVESFVSVLENYKNNNKYATGYVSSGNVLMANPAYSTIFVPLQENENYTFWLVGQDGSKTLSSVVFLDDNGNIISKSSGWLSSAYTHQATTNEKWAMVGLKTSDFNDFQIEKGTVATEYEEYKGNNYVIPTTPLRSLPNGVKDTIEEDGIHRRVGSIVLNGSENWTKYSLTTPSGDHVYLVPIPDCKKSTITMGTSVCSHFKNNPYAWDIGKKGQFSDHPSLQNKYFVTDILTLPDFKTWLSENPIQVDYELAEEVIEPFDEQQQKEISKLQNLFLYDGENNIYSLGDVKANLKLTYADAQNIENIDAMSMNSKLEINKRYGPINIVSLAMKNIEGENVTLKDIDSMGEYGETMLTIFDNPFTYSEELREQAITELYYTLRGFVYFPTKFNYKARLYTDCADVIMVENVQTKEFVPSLILNQHIKIPATRQSSLENLALSDTAIKNQYISQSKQDESRTEVLVDKINKSINYYVGQTNEKFTDINQRADGIETKIEDTTDEFNDKIAEINEDIRGLQTRLTSTGGQNLVRNSVGYFGNEFWELEDPEQNSKVVGEDSTDVKQNSVSGSALKIQAETITQILSSGIKNGEYYVSFRYKKLLPQAIAKLKINDKEYNLTETNWYEISEILTVATNQIRIEITSDLDNSALITDLTITSGTTKIGWSQNANESYSDTVQIGKGVKITSSVAETEFAAEATGVTIKNTQTNQITSEFTKYGTKTEELEVRKQAKISELLLIQRIGDQVWFSTIGTTGL